MTTLHIELPDSISELLHQPVSELSRYVLLSAAAKWYELGLISQGTGAEISGLSREAFMLALSRMRISPFQYTAEELEEELRDTD
ncbi:MAG: UPF0175 family protein [Gammaproteobacteria bacterium]|nr:UPF0175 family protein [Gammaproteobacteria bacterium]